MVAEWTRFCQASDLVLDGPHIIIHHVSGRASSPCDSR